MSPWHSISLGWVVEESEACGQALPSPPVRSLEEKRQSFGGRGKPLSVTQKTFVRCMDQRTHGTVRSWSGFVSGHQMVGGPRGATWLMLATFIDQKQCGWFHGTICQGEGVGTPGDVAMLSVGVRASLNSLLSSM